ncbi:MAG TPA: hypothetical protein VF808_03310 [Ktedonobacterales bacterium]
MARSSGLDAPQQHAITDVYDAETGFFLVRYPPALVITLALTGLIAFATAGFLGYEKVSFFYKPWALYLWFSALVVTLLWSIYRNRALRGQLITVLIVAGICIILAYLIGNPTGFIRKLLEQYLPLLAKEQLTYVVINFGLIVIYWVDTLRRWARRAQGLRPHAELDLTTGKRTDTAVPEELPSMSELVSGDLIAGAVLTGALSYLFKPVVMSFITQTNLTDCSLSVSFPPSGCVDGQNNVLASLTLIDQTQALTYLSVGLIVLAVAATMGGFGSVGGAPMPIGVSREVLASLADGPVPVTTPITTGVAETIIDALRAAIGRRLREFFLSIVRALRNVVWPVLLFTTMFGVFQLSQSVQTYLHEPKTLTSALRNIAPAAGWGIICVLAVVFSAALVIFKWRVVDNTLRFLGLIGLIVLLTFWIFSAALWLINLLIEQFDAKVVKPFDPPSIATYVSLGALVILGGFLIFSRRGLNFLPRQAARSRPTAASASSASSASRTTQE